MTRPWQTLDKKETSDGLLELRKRSKDDFLILIGGRVLMNSRASRSEEVLGIKTCSELQSGARILVGGLGMGITLRAVLNSTPPDVTITVAELHPAIVEWCRGPLAPLTEAAVLDPRVETKIADVAECIRHAPSDGDTYDAIVLDLFEGPHSRTDEKGDPFYGSKALERTRNALTPGGVLGVWSEAPDESFRRRLEAQGFRTETHRTGRGGLRHWVVLGRRPGLSEPAKPE
ncbi:MAG: spermidine synthase [Gemmatimonadota bacterium]|nr:spermidine synthase [Gemmatimonadota bacterium]